MEQKNGKTRSLFKNKGSHSKKKSKQLTADEKFSEQGVRLKKRVSRLRCDSVSTPSSTSSSTSPSPFRRDLFDYDSQLLVPPTPTLRCNPHTEPYFWFDSSSAQRPPALLRPSLESLSQHGSPSLLNPPPLFNPSTHCPVSAGYDTDSREKTALQAQTEEINEDRYKTLYKNQGRQSSILEKQMNAEEKISEEVDQGTSASSFKHLWDHVGQLHPYPRLLAYGSSTQPVSDIVDPGESLKNYARGLQSDSEHECVYGAIELMRPPDTDEYYSAKYSLPVDSHHQQLQGSVSRRTPGCYLPSPPRQPRPEKRLFAGHNAGLSDNKFNSSGLIIPAITDDADSDCDIGMAPLSHHSIAYKPKKEGGHGFMSNTKYWKNSFSIASTSGSPYCMLRQPPPGTFTETGMIKHQCSAAEAALGVNQDNTWKIEPHATAGPSTFQLSINNDSDSVSFYDTEKEWDASSDTYIISNALNNPAPTVPSSPCPQGRPAALQDSTVCTEGSGAQDGFELLSVQSESESGGDTDSLVEMESFIGAANCSVTCSLPTFPHLHKFSVWSGRDSSCLPRSHSMPSLSQITSAINQTFTRAISLPDMMLKTGCEEFTPDITVDENDETYRFQCSCPGLYQCSVTGLVFRMGGEGAVVYRIVPWNRRLLAQHHKQPAGPLFDIKCVQQSVCQLHLPHCEIRSTGGCDFLSVAHENDEGIEFMAPHKITETHVIINITGFSGFGIVKDEDSPPDPVRALVLLFYRPPADPDPESLLNVLLLPGNVVLRDVQRTRKKLVGDELYVETSPRCKLQPEQEYKLSTCPEDNAVLVQPAEAEFDCDNYDNYFPSFQVTWEKVMKHMTLSLRDTNSSHSVWERRVCLSSSGVKRSCGQSALSLPPHERLLDIRSSFIDGISGPVLKSLLDKLFEKKVMTDSERESADEIQNRQDKARFVIDTVRKKGEAASSEMIEFLCEADPFLCEHLGLM